MKSANRNDACPCGSGLKYKKCCLDKGGALAPAAAPAPELPTLQQHIDLVITCANSGNLFEATKLCKHLLDHYPNNPLVLFTTARIMFWNGMRDSCVMLLQKAIAINPSNAAYYSLLADIYLIEKQAGPAYQAISKAIELDPNEPAYIYFKVIFILNTISSFSHDDALDMLRDLIRTHPHFYKSYETLYKNLDERRCYEEASAVYQKLVDLNPPVEAFLPFLALPLKNYCSRDEITRERTILEQNIARIAASDIKMNPANVIRNVMFALTYHASNNRPLLEKLSALYRNIFPSINVVDENAAHRLTGGVIKIGFISCFFVDSHVVMQLLKHFIQSFAKDKRYKTIIFDVGNKGTDLSLVKEGGAVHVPLPDNLSDTTYHLVAEQECDVLVYLDIGMHATTYLMAFARLSPLQFVLNGHPITTGISTVDYYVSCKAWEAPNAQNYYTEKLILLDNILASIEKPPVPNTVCTRKELGFPEEGNLYICPAMTFKIHPDFYDTVVKILQADPKGIAIFIRSTGFADEVILAHFSRLAPEESKRVMFAPWIDKDKFIPAMALCDVIIDPFHFGLATTMFKIFTVGTPVVTWTGEFMHGRIPTGLYQKMGITELIAKDWDDYIKIAVRLANDKAYNQSMRKKILESNHVIYGENGAAAEFKQILEGLIDKNKKE